MIDCKSPIEHFKKYNDVDIFLKRDDKIPFSFGGNKVRLAVSVFKDMLEHDFSSIISYGSQNSNLNRVIAQMALKEHIPCWVIIKKEAKKTCFDTSIPKNELLIRKSRAKISYCDESSVQTAVAQAINEAIRLGERPYYIYGDSWGHGRECTLMSAFLDEYEEIKSWENENSLHFDHIFLAVGTGFTISGLLAAFPKDTILHGISISRDAIKLQELIQENLRIYYQSNKKIPQPGFNPPKFDITDEYLAGGYGCFDNEELYVIRKIYKEEGIAMDLTYTGKAFFGMLSEIKKQTLRGNCLFIHTGGYPLFEDAKGLILGN